MRKSKLYAQEINIFVSDVELKKQFHLSDATKFYIGGATCGLVKVYYFNSAHSSTQYAVQFTPIVEEIPF